MDRMYGDQVSSSMSHQDNYRKRLVVMMCRCDEGLVKYGALFVDFITVLFFQMKEVPKDFFVDIVSSSNFLSSCLNSLFSNIKTSSEVDKKLKEKAEKFESNVTKRFGWDFTVDQDEDSPVVVG